MGPGWQARKKKPGREQEQESPPSFTRRREDENACSGVGCGFGRGEKKRERERERRVRIERNKPKKAARKRNVDMPSFVCATRPCFTFYICCNAVRGTIQMMSDPRSAHFYTLYKSTPPGPTRTFWTLGEGKINQTPPFPLFASDNNPQRCRLSKIGTSCFLLLVTT